MSVWGYFQFAQMWAYADAQDSFEWEFGPEFVELKFSRDGGEHHQRIVLTFTPCRLGDSRRWFVCPFCARRVGKVYLPCSMYAGGERVTRFACRSCYSLTYLQRQDRDLYWCLLHRAHRMEGRWFTYSEKDKLFYPLKWQRRDKFNKRVDEYERLIQLVNAYMLRGLLRAAG
ncbi:MAG: hypothetical protein HY257_04675 [Chloroflexi bacterium]|nr:hypothetical protein [Chloroflexota bacterium]